MTVKECLHSYAHNSISDLCNFNKWRKLESSIIKKNKKLEVGLLARKRHAGNKRLKPRTESHDHLVLLLITLLTEDCFKSEMEKSTGFIAQLSKYKEKWTHMGQCQLER